MAKAKTERTVIITCAVTGSIHTPSMSPHLPVTPTIAEACIAAAEAGASILHLHARDPDNGRPTQDPDMFMRFLPRIKQSCEAIVNITTGGSPHMTVFSGRAQGSPGRSCGGDYVAGYRQAGATKSLQACQGQDRSGPQR